MFDTANPIGLRLISAVSHSARGLRPSAMGCSGPVRRPVLSGPSSTRSLRARGVWTGLLQAQTRDHVGDGKEPRAPGHVLAERRPRSRHRRGSTTTRLEPASSQHTPLTRNTSPFGVPEILRCAFFAFNPGHCSAAKRHGLSFLGKKIGRTTDIGCLDLFPKRKSGILRTSLCARGGT